MPALAVDLVRKQVDVIVTDGGAVNVAAQSATSTIPIVAATLQNPVESGLAKSLSHPGGNVTGFVLTVVETNAKRLDILKGAFANTQKVALLWNKAAGTLFLEPVQKAGLALKTQIEAFPVDGPGNLARAFADVATSGADGLMTLPDGVFFNNRQIIVHLAALSKLPAIYPEREYVEAGGLMAYGTVVAENFRKVAGYVDKILKGAKPGDLPIQEPTRYELILNLKTAQALGISIPNSLLALADQVIE